MSFGSTRRVAVVVPAGGTRTSAKVAYVQHLYARHWRTMADRPSGAEMGSQYGFSKQTWSRAVLGETWMGLTLFAALLDALHRHRAAGARTAEP
jgi:hypothetical protein